MTILVGLVDSGVGGPVSSYVVTGERFTAKEGGVLRGIAESDRLHHGTVLAEIIVSQAPQCRLLNAQVFGDAPVTSPDAVAEALLWAVDRGAKIVNLSIGLPHDRLVLRQACRAAIDRGVFLLAASPARGAPVFPAAYEGVWRISGDARCAPGEISALQNEQADFGANPRGINMREGVDGGSSFSVGWVSGLMAAYLQDHPGADRAQITRHLLSLSRYQGAERRLS